MLRSWVRDEVGWWPSSAPFLYAGVPLAWLAMAVLSIERLIAARLDGWFAAGAWAFANVVAGVVYHKVRTIRRGATTATTSGDVCQVISPDEGAGQ